MDKITKLTDEKNWNKVWEVHSLPQVFKTSCNPSYVEILDGCFHKYLPYNKDFDFLELGCAPGRWLHYFHTEFGYKVSGLDYSKTGLEITEKNLRTIDVKADLHFGDVVNYQFTKKYDVVFSNGFVEHFYPPKQIIQKHLEVLKPGGYLVIIVPNIKKAIYGTLQKIINRKNLEGYIHISDKELFNLLNKKVKLVFCGYIGVFNLYLLNIPLEKKFIYKSITLMQIAIDTLLKVLKIKKETKLFSPYIIVIAKKK